MILENIILMTTIIIIIASLVLFIPKEKVRDACLIFLFKESITWIIGLYVVQKGWIEYPIRLVFEKATSTSFVFEFLVYPAICVFFNLNYPQKSTPFVKVMYYCLIVSAITAFEAFLESHTLLIKYTGWTWYWTWLTLFATFYASRKFYLWFFKRLLPTR